ncbi:TonB-dependent receptor [Ascidiimonas sp. W6]|uniref:TonB-dependent receptor n=1 Tax=Ascidiimonas meishanensis TaxID=3128903 RepID=UPI0030EEC10C
MKYVIITIFLLVSVCKVYTQDCDYILKGEVFDFHEGTPLKGAIIQIIGAKKQYETNSKGSFTIKNLCNRIYELEITHSDCQTLIIPVTIEENTLKRFYLEHHLEELEEVKVTGDAKRKKTNSAQENTINTKLLQKYASGSLGDALKEITGVSSFNTGAAIVKPVIQGLNGSRVLIINNGVRMQDMEWGDEHAPNIDVNASGSVTVIKGASALQYGGDAVGGVIITEPSKIIIKDTLYGSTTFTGATNGRGGSLTSKLIKGFDKGWYLKAQGSIKRFGDFEAPDYVLSNTGVLEKAGSFNAGINKFTHGFDFYYSYFQTNIAVLRASHIGNVDDLINAINSPLPLVIDPFTYDISRPRQEVTHHLARARFFKRYEGLGKLNIQYDFQFNNRFEYDVRVGDDRDKPAIDLQLTTHTIQSDFKFDSKDTAQFHTGILVRYQDNFANPATGVRRLIPDYQKFDAGIFFSNSYAFSSKLIVDAGFRYDFNRIDAKKFYLNSRWEERGYEEDFGDIVTQNLESQLLVNPVFDYHNISFTTGLKYDIDENTEFRFNYVLAQRAPNPSELFSDGLHHSAARIELGDLRIKQETSNKITASIKNSSSKWGWEIAPFLNLMNDFIILEPTDVEFTIRGAFPLWEYRQTNARLIGIDASAYVNWTSRWRTNHQFSLVKGLDTSLDIPLINIPAPKLTNKISYYLKKWHNLNVGLESNYLFEQNETPPNITVFSPQANEEVLLRINDAPQAAHVLNANANIDFELSKNKILEIGLTVNNFLNTSYRDYLNRLRYFADDLGRNFLIRLTFNY